MRPSVTLAAPWIYVVATLLVGALLTAKFPDAGEPLRIVSSSFLLIVSTGNGLALAALAIDAVAAWRQPRALRRGPLAGVALCVVNVLLLQYGALLAHAVIAAPI